MKKIILYMTILLFALTKVANSQVATIETVPGSVNINGYYTNTPVNVYLNGYNSSTNKISAITMKIAYDPNVASFTGITDGAIIGASANAVGNYIYIAWTAPYNQSGALPTSIPNTNTVGFVLHFDYTGGSCNLTFDPANCDIANSDASGSTQTTYLNGAINQPTLSPNPTATILPQAGDYTIVNDLPITFANLPSTVGAITLNLSYDPNVLQFVGLTGLTNANYNALNGIIHITWVCPIVGNAPQPINLTDIHLKFNYMGGVSNVSFTGTNIISNATGVQLPITLNNGSITQPSTNYSVTIGDGTNVGQTTGLTSIPVTFAGSSGFPTNLGAFSMNVAYNSSKLTFVSATDLNGSPLAGLNANALNNTINVSWVTTDPQNGQSIPGYKLNFNYISGADTLRFTGLNQVSTINSNAILPVTYNNGYVLQAATQADVTLGNVSFSGSTASVPVNLTNVNASINSATMYVNFDNTRLTYSGYSDAQSGAVINQDPTTKTIIINWYDINTALTNNSTFINLNFTFNGGAGNCDVPVYFTTLNNTASSLAGLNNATIQANWNNGNVNVAPSAPTGLSAQSFCSTSVHTVANLTTTTVGNINWYATPTGGTVLDGSTVLVDATHYYASQTVGSCESVNRLDVLVTVNTTPVQPTASAVANCNGTTTITASSYTGSLLWSTNETSASIIVNDGNVYSVTQTVNGCTSLPGSDFAIPKTTPAPPTASAVANCDGTTTITATNYTGTLLWSTNETSASIIVNDGNVYSVTQTENGCTSTAGSASETPKTTPVQPTVVAVPNCDGTTTITASIFTGTLLWSTNATTTSITVNDGNVYSVTQTVSGCTSLPGSASATPKTTPAPPAVQATETYCSATAPTVASLTGSGLTWYASVGSVTPLLTTDALVNGASYYATQTVTGCESAKSTADVVTINTTPAPPTADLIQTLCAGATVANLTVAGTDVKWHTASTNGTLYLNIDALVNGTHYFASQTVNSCESSRTDVTVNVNAKPTAVLSGTQSLNNGSIANLTITATGTGPFSGTLTDGTNTVNYNGATSPLTVPVTPNVNTTYTIATLSDATCTAEAGGLSGSAIVTVKYKISGVLKYANTGTVRPINTNATSTSTVYLYQSDGITEVTHVNTDYNGNYEFYIQNGTYVISAVTDKPIGGINAGDAIIVKNQTGTFVSGTLSFQAADVNINSTINAGDAIIIQTYVNTLTKPLSWKAPNWIFERLNVIISNQNSLNNDVRGVCSGDVNASYQITL